MESLIGIWVMCTGPHWHMIISCFTCANKKVSHKKLPWGRMLLVMLSRREKSASCFFTTSFAFISTTCLEGTYLELKVKGPPQIAIIYAGQGQEDPRRIGWKTWTRDERMKGKLHSRRLEALDFGRWCENLMLCWTRLKTAFFNIQLSGPSPCRPTCQYDTNINKWLK